MNAAPRRWKVGRLWVGFGAAAACSPGAWASAALVSPLDPAAAVPALVYRSSLSTYVGGPPPAVGDWRSAMDTVTRMGGWREYAKQGVPASASSQHPGPTVPAAPGAWPKR